MSVVVVFMPAGCRAGPAGTIRNDPEATLRSSLGCLDNHAKEPTSDVAQWLTTAVMEPSEDVAAVLAEVGPRLKRLRTHRGVTLTDLAAKTGISKSTLSRLETGQRKPSLELLLPIAQVASVPLDELVGATEIGDPRIRPKARKRNGRIVIPLSENTQASTPGRS